MKRLIFITSIIILNSCSNKQPRKNGQSESNVNSIKAYEYQGLRKTDSAFKYFDIAKDELLLLKDSIGVANSMLNMSIIATYEGDYFGGQEMSLNALSYLSEKNKNHLFYIHSNYNSVGYANSRLGNYKTALRFYNLALKFATENKDRFLYLNNIAKVYEELKKYDKAIKIYSRVLKETPRETAQYAQALANLASTKWHQNPSYNAAQELLYALSINSKEGNEWGLNFCYARLADFYSEKNDDRALSYAEKMYEIAKTLKSPHDQLEALYKLVKLSPATQSKNYFIIYEKLDDSLQIARAKAKNQFALIRYDTVKLEKENAEKKYELIKQKSLSIGIFLLAIAFGIIGFLLYRKRKQRIELEAQNSIRENQLYTSKTVHDRVANKIYSVISEIENTKELDKNHLLDKLDHIYHTSRDISYEITDSQQGKKFSQQLSEMFYTYVADPPLVKITGNEDGIWTNVSANSKGEIFIVLEELMTNMKKHSRATEVNIQFHKTDKFISIHYDDNGIGMPKNVVHNNGLRNTETRIKNISGTLTFEKMDKAGLEILISFPIN